ncbi:MAG TPA: bifunctional phosphopantothenoylcysteine decarboxylase/phosphopantothenate--cysteine ligase CoaBC [Methanocorpusculum sp.]|nr:bifunctional phosphopantothenoylcysteine decarboxylase/phosphopantothenate--cysteine ligase CoaBC [Methanocorpusculum sp.]
MKSLENKRIVLAVTGSIAAVDTVRLAHELRRRGADVIPVMSEAAAGLIHPEALTYACGHPCITKISGMVEHVEYCGEGGKADLLLIAPSTANTISKIAVGIDDTPVTTFATTAIGRGMPIVLAPAMHESMYRHPAVRKNLKILEDEFNISVVPPKMEEERAKIAEIETICLYVERALYPHDLDGKSVLITSGSCRETVDSVRVLTTRSSGTMGRELALEAFRRGADVTVVMNTALHGFIPGVRSVTIESAADMQRAVMEELKCRTIDYYISAAAISDFTPDVSKTKIHSGTPVTLTLHLAPKLISQVTGPKIIGFKIGEDAHEAAQSLMNSQKNIIAVAANYPATMGSADGIYRVYRKGADAIDITGTKKEIAYALWNAVL